MAVHNDPSASSNDQVDFATAPAVGTPATTEEIEAVLERSRRLCEITRKVLAKSKESAQTSVEAEKVLCPSASLNNGIKEKALKDTASAKKAIVKPLDFLKASQREKVLAFVEGLTRDDIEEFETALNHILKAQGKKPFDFSKYQDLETLKRDLSQKFALMVHLLKNKQNPLHYAIKFACPKIVEMLLATAESPAELSSSHFSKAATAYLMFAGEDQLKIMELMLKAGANPNVVIKGVKLFNLSIKNEDEKLAMLLVKHGVAMTDQHTVDATKNGMMDLVFEMIKAGANPKAMDEQNQPLTFHIMVVDRYDILDYLTTQEGFQFDEILHCLIDHLDGRILIDFLDMYPNHCNLDYRDAETCQTPLQRVSITSFEVGSYVETFKESPNAVAPLVRVFRNSTEDERREGLIARVTHLQFLAALMDDECYKMILDGINTLTSDQQEILGQFTRCCGDTAKIEAFTKALENCDPVVLATLLNFSDVSIKEKFLEKAIAGLKALKRKFAGISAMVRSLKQDVETKKGPDTLTKRYSELHEEVLAIFKAMQPLAHCDEFSAEVIDVKELVQTWKKDLEYIQTKLPKTQLSEKEQDLELESLAYLTRYMGERPTLENYETVFGATAQEIYQRGLLSGQDIAYVIEGADSEPKQLALIQQYLKSSVKTFEESDGSVSLEDFLKALQKRMFGISITHKDILNLDKYTEALAQRRNEPELCSSIIQSLS